MSFVWPKLRPSEQRNNLWLNKLGQIWKQRDFKCSRLFKERNFLLLIKIRRRKRKFLYFINFSAKSSVSIPLGQTDGMRRLQFAKCLFNLILSLFSLALLPLALYHLHFYHLHFYHLPNVCLTGPPISLVHFSSFFIQDSTICKMSV